ncbi:type II toxin-antitoxin system PemK/MazF family toxin [Actinomadura sp. BRA 177]|uniref:type II toxin-antitoxin system PemK/MazF family toxin n=1 Tax=Actinomadura sp. BRA 177 TaxID=2745202 RepID=UPI001595FC78|nr:type II toxin-antitoxin system PemK/MazF family toxin [Actinomadura sp. BRA 177]NVI89193.1 type II toxin-antitoxin system PemK/MazF family toxin [Actinomadura sp. BRA 177]
MRGDVYKFLNPRGAKGHEQQGHRYAVVVQSDLLPLSTWLVAPTSTSARPASFRPEVEVAGKTTRVLAEQTAAIDPQRLGSQVGTLSFNELRAVDAALLTVLGLAF